MAITVKEMKVGRVFEIRYEAGDDFFPELNKLVKEKNIRAGSVFLMGALTETFMISGFNSMSGYDVNRHHFKD